MQSGPGISSEAVNPIQLRSNDSLLMWRTSLLEPLGVTS